MNWIFLLVVAYLLIALASLVDKFMLTKATEPVIYMFLVSLFGLAIVILAPFGFVVPTWQVLVVSAIAGGSYTLAIFFLYKAVQYNEASRVFTFVGAMVAVSTFIFSYFFLGERLSWPQIVAFMILIVGGILISLENKNGGVSRNFGYTYLSALLFGIAYTGTKFSYSYQPFISGFIWIRIFAFVAALLFLFSAHNRLLVVKNFQEKSPIRKRSTQIILLAGQAGTGVGFLILNYVISLTSASLVTAAQGLQYAFLLLFIVFVSKKYPNIISEKIDSAALSQKVFAIIMIACGLGLLAFNV